MISINHIKSEFLKSIEYQQMTENSKKNYLSQLNQLPQVESESPREFVNTIYQDVLLQPISNSTKNLRITMLKQILDWAFRQDIITTALTPYFPKRRLISEPKQETPLTQNEIDRIDLSTTSKEDLPYAMVIKFLFYSGCRVTEAINLTKDCIDGEYINIMSAKDREIGTIGRLIYITPHIKKILSYVRKDSKYLFPNLSGNKMAHTILKRKKDKIFKNLGIQMRQLRATRSGLATELLRNKTPIEDVSYILGHKTIVTTQRYTRLSMMEKAKLLKGKLK